MLRPYRRIVLVAAREPVAFFAYPDKPSRLTGEGVEFVELAARTATSRGALDALCDAVGAQARAARRRGTGAAAGARRTAGPTPDSIARVLGALIPENAIVVDESVTTGRGFFGQTAGAPPHDWLNNSGGSIGYGMPVATGAAIACPDRKVLALEGDGSAMYTVQALWTHGARGAGRHHRHLRQPQLPDPARRADECRRRQSRPARAWTC